jgi:hypothetical protein
MTRFVSSEMSARLGIASRMLAGTLAASEEIVGVRENFKMFIIHMCKCI